MTSGESSTPGYDFNSIVYEMSGIDQGVVNYMEKLASFEKALNNTGGKTSIQYDEALTAVDKDWPLHDASATLSGRLYLFGGIVDTEALDRATELWGSPSRDEGGIYWFVDDAILASRGIVDCMEGEHVEFAQAFSFGDDGLPAFFVRRGESVTEFDRLTSEGSEQYLRAEWSELVARVDELLPGDAYDVMAIQSLATTICEEYQDELFAYDKLRSALSQYVTHRACFSDSAAYAVLLQGPVKYYDEDDVIHSLDIKQRYWEYVYKPEVAFCLTDESVDSAFVARANEGRDDSEVIAIPSTTIKEIHSTYMGESILERMQPVVEFHHDDLSPIEIVEEPLTVREKRLEQLRTVQLAIMSITNIAKDMADFVCETEEEAEELAQSRLGSIQSIASSVNLRNYSLRIEGDQVCLAPTQYDFHRTDDGSLIVRPQGNIDFMESIDDRVGIRPEIYPTHSIISDDSDDDVSYRPSLMLRVLLSDYTEETAYVNNIPVAEQTAHSYAVTPLDESTIVVEGLDTEELIDNSIRQLTRDDKRDVVERLERVYGEICAGKNEEMDQEAVTALHDIARLFDTVDDQLTLKHVTTIVEGILNDKRTAFNTSNDPNELIMGTITDVGYESSPDFPPSGLVVSLAADDGSYYSVTVDSIKTMLFPRGE